MGHIEQEKQIINTIFSCKLWKMNSENEKKNSYKRICGRKWTTKIYCNSKIKEKKNPMN